MVIYLFRYNSFYSLRPEYFYRRNILVIHIFDFLFHDDLINYFSYFPFKNGNGYYCLACYLLDIRKYINSKI